MNPKPLIIKAIKLIMFAALFVVVERLCHRATDGFAMVNIYSPPHKPKKDWSISISDKEKKALKERLNQPFHYLNCGAQSYVFESADKTLVLKLFKYHHMRVIPWLEPLPILQNWKEKKKEKKNREITLHFTSYALAMNRLKEETGLIYAHLNPTSDLQCKLTISDKLGIQHSIDLDKVDFLVQERGTLAYEKIDEWMKRGEENLAKQGISNLLRLADERCMKGIADKDPDFQTNFGFITGVTPFQLDIGRFSIDSSKKESHADELYRISAPFREWIALHHPTLTKHFDQALHEITH